MSLWDLQFLAKGLLLSTFSTDRFPAWSVCLILWSEHSVSRKSSSIDQMIFYLFKFLNTVNTVWFQEISILPSTEGIWNPHHISLQKFHCSFILSFEKFSFRALSLRNLQYPSIGGSTRYFLETQMRYF